MSIKCKNCLIYLDGKEPGVAFVYCKRRVKLVRGYMPADKCKFFTDPEDDGKGYDQPYYKKVVRGDFKTPPYFNSLY